MREDERTPPEQRDEQEDLRRRQGEFLQNLLTDVQERKQQAADDLFETLARAHEKAKGREVGNDG